jgi:hypothetical protein
MFCSEPYICVICLSTDGKTDTEIQFKTIYNQKYANYPLLPLFKAYGCNCKSFAHNKCLLSINKCPTCRKIVSKPNLYFDWIKKDTPRIEKMKWYAILYIIIMCLLLYKIDKIVGKELFDTIVPKSDGSYGSLCFAIIMITLYLLLLLLLFCYIK